MLKEGDSAPDFELPDQNGNNIKFYPKDNTPGCTKEALNFRDNIKEYENKDIKIIGISADSVESHKKFEKKNNLNFTLLSDRDKLAAKTFGARSGSKVKRMTWIIDKDWKIEKVYEKVSPTKHHAQLCEYFEIPN